MSQKRKQHSEIKRYEAEGYHFEYRGRRFPQFSQREHIRIENFNDRDRVARLKAFAKRRRESVLQTMQMLGSQSMVTGLTLDELLQHHWFSRWQGGLTRSERARLAAHKAWNTIREKRRVAEDEQCAKS